MRMFHARVAFVASLHIVRFEDAKGCQRVRLVVIIQLRFRIYLTSNHLVTDRANRRERRHSPHAATSIGCCIGATAIRSCSS